MTTKEMLTNLIQVKGAKDSIYTEEMIFSLCDNYFNFHLDCFSLIFLDSGFDSSN